MGTPERRDSDRLHSRLYADYRIQGTGEKVQSVTRNISGSGLCCSTQDSLPLGSVVDVKIYFPVREEPVACRAEVMWNRRRENQVHSPNSFESGFRFMDLDPQEQVFVERHVTLDVPWEK